MNDDQMTTRRWVFAAVLAVVIAVLGLVFAHEAAAYTTGNDWLVRNIGGGSICSYTCDIAYTKQQYGTPVKFIGTGNPITIPGGIFFSYGNKLVLLPNHQRNAFKALEEGTAWKSWARKPCVGSPGYNYSATMYLGPGGGPYSGIGWDWGTLTILPGCHPVESPVEMP